MDIILCSRVGTKPTYPWLYGDDVSILKSGRHVPDGAAEQLLRRIGQGFKTLPLHSGAMLKLYQAL